MKTTETIRKRSSNSKSQRGRAARGAIVALALGLVYGCETDDDGPNAGADECTASEDAGPSGTRQELSCQVAIIGGGAGGLHTAYRLGDELGKEVCLFEKEERLGGRIYDVSKDGKADSPRIGIGARRIMETQDIVFALADELGIEYAPPAEYEDLYVARGVSGYSSDELNQKAYPALPDDEDYETSLYEQLMTLDGIDKYSDFQSYARATVGAEAFEFLHDTSRFRADFQAPLDARGYMDYFVEEWDTCCTYNYPKGGMSEFIRRMAEKAEKAGVRIFTSDPVASIDRVKGGFRLLTKEHEVSAEKVVIAVDAGALKWIQGDVVADIKDQQQFQQLFGVKAVSVTQWWPKAWWEGAIAGHDVRRARTTQNCLNVIEIPTDPYGGPQNVTRTVYSDDPRCVPLWEEYIAQGNTEAIEAEIARDLAQLFPDASIPKPDKTLGHIWENAWYWLKAGSPFTNLDIAKWAVEPLEGEQVALVGESYNPQRSGWSDAAYKSSIATLNARFGLDLEGDARTPKARAQKRTRRKHGYEAIRH